jgi:hypothetical protein
MTYKSEWVVVTGSLQAGVNWVLGPFASSDDAHAYARERERPGDYHVTVLCMPLSLKDVTPSV